MIVRTSVCKRHVFSIPETFRPAFVKVSITSHHGPERVEEGGEAQIWERQGNCRQVTIKLTDRLRNLVQLHCGTATNPATNASLSLSLIFLAPLQDFLAGLNVAHRGIERFHDGCDGQIAVPHFSSGVDSIHDAGVHLLQLLDCETRRASY